MIGMETSIRPAAINMAGVWVREAQDDVCEHGAREVLAL